MAADVSASLPELTLPPGATITVELDDPAAVVTEVNVFGYSPLREQDAQTEPTPVLLGYVTPEGG